jgi:hypothetical protein
MNIFETSDLYLLMQGRAVSWLAMDSNGVAVNLAPQPLMIRAAFVQSPFEQGLSAARTQLAGDRCWLFAFTDCPDGPPYRTALLFIYQRELNITWQDGPYSRMGKSAHLYSRATQVFSVGSEDGFYLTGPGGDGSIWRVFRSELDALNRWVLTVSPVRLSSKFPQADFSGLKAPLLADSVRAQYAALATAITANSYLAVVTAAKNIVEAIVADKLGNAGKSRDLSDNLQTIKKLIEDSPQDGSCGWTHLEYHLAQKIRLVHGQTHATAPVRMGRPVRPEFALSAVEDLIELLRIWGCCRT